MADTPKYRVEREIYQSRMRLPQEADPLEYRAVSGLALTGLLLGLLAPIVLVTQAAWVLAIAGVVVNAMALRRIAANAPALMGRKAALVGLALSVAFGVAVPVDWLLYRRLVRDEARQFAAIWFDFLRANQPHKAQELTVLPISRDPLDEKLWGFFQKGTDQRRMLESFIYKPEIRALLALGDKATVRFYDTESQWAENDGDRVYQTYAVTFSDSEGLKTFFVGLLLERSMDSRSGHSYWRVSRTEGGVRPKALGGSGAPPKA
jgi:hypothetical protein